MLPSVKEDIQCDVMVIGAGMAGMASALFAARKGFSTIQTGVFGEMLFASGLLDLMGVYPASQGKKWDNPWAAIEALKKEQPNHMFARMDSADIHQAMDEMMVFLRDAGFPYERHENRNARVVTPLGTVKRTWGVPATMWNGVTVLEKKAPCLLIDFQGFKGFSARQISMSLAKKWPELRSLRIAFPGIGQVDELYAEQAARYLELDEHRERFAEALRPHLKDCQYVGFPSILGILKANDVFLDLQERLGVQVFEIPGMPPSLNGLRLVEVFREHLPGAGVKTFYQKKVLGCHVGEDQRFILSVGARENEVTVSAKNIILATGRFFGKGLYGDRNRLKESLFDLPVHQPGSRKEWYRKDLLTMEGHEINNAGLEVDDLFRPLDGSGRAAFKRLFAAGSIIAHNDWKRMKCGTGTAVASGYYAVKSMLTA